MLNGYIMSKDITVAEVIDNDLNILRTDLCPILLLRSKNVDYWLEHRAIDTHRPSSRVLRKMLRISTSNPVKIVLKFNAISLTDTYWFKEKESSLCWEEAVKVTEYFHDVIVHNAIDMDKLPKDMRTFELTNIGSYEKCWKKDGNDWLMLKRQSRSEVVSELLSYKLGRLLGFNVAKYFESEENIIASYNFIHDWDYNFEDAYSVVGDEEDVSYNFEKLSELSTNLIEGYFEMLVFDALFQNVDRHTHNYGFLRDVKTGKILSFAPLYDHNMSLYGSKMELKKHSPEMFFDAIKEGLKYCKTYKLPIIYRDLLDKVSNDKLVNDFVYNNYCKIKNILKEN